MPLAVKAIQALLATAQQKKHEEDTKELREQVAAEQQLISLEQNKHASLSVQLVNNRNEQVMLKGLMTQLEATKKYISAGDYAEAVESLNTQILTLIEAYEKDQQLDAQMAADIAARCQNLDQLRDRLKCADDPSYTPKYPTSRPTHVLVQDCRKIIQDAYTEASTLCNRLQELNNNHAAITAAIKLVAGSLRRLHEQSHPLNEAEEIMMRRAFGTVTTQVKDFCTEYISALNKNYHYDWSRYVIEAREELHKATRHQKTPGKKVEVKAELPEDLEEKKLIAALLTSKLVEKLEGKRMAFYGGMSGERHRVDLIEWLEGALRLGRCKTFDGHRQDNNSEDRLAQSVRTGGMDILVVFTHRTSASVRSSTLKLVQAHKVPYIQVNAYSKFDVCEQLAALYKVNLNISGAIV